MQKYIVVGDVHSCGEQLQAVVEFAIEKQLPVLFLGDLVDRGPTPGLVFNCIRELQRRNLMGPLIVGNHEHKHYRRLIGRDVSMSHGVEATAKYFNDHPEDATFYKELIEQSFLMYRDGTNYFVHAAMPSGLYASDSVKYIDFIEKRIPKKGMDVLLYGYTNGKQTADGFPERLMDWVQKVPADCVVYKGHDFMYDTIHEECSSNGGRVVFMDTGSGHKNGHLMWRVV